MDETDKLMVAATAMNDATDVLDDLATRLPAGVARNHLGVARSSLGQAVNHVRMAVRAMVPLLPEGASAGVSTEPPRRD